MGCSKEKEPGNSKAEFAVCVLFIIIFSFSIIGFGFVCQKGWDLFFKKVHWSDSKALLNLKP